MMKLLNVLKCAIVCGVFSLSAAAAADLGANADTAPAQCDSAAVSADTDRTHLDDIAELIMLAPGHPNERFRFAGAKGAAAGHWEYAFANFRRAARYADKYSQHRISMLYWHGCGVERDPSAAYAWADLAAERLYPDFIVLRERMWNALDETQRARAIEIGREIYAEYGDAVAKPRFAAALGQAKRKTTGSRTGFQNRLVVSAKPIGADPREKALRLCSGTSVAQIGDLYRKERWTPKTYWTQQDTHWRTGTVLVGALQDVEARKDGEARHDAEVKPATP
jgi:uncharacterized protein